MEVFDYNSADSSPYSGNLDSTFLKSWVMVHNGLSQGEFRVPGRMDQSCLLLLDNLQMGANLVMMHLTLVQLMVDHQVLLLLSNLEVLLVWDLEVLLPQDSLFLLFWPLRLLLNQLQLPDLLGLNLEIAMHFLLRRFVWGRAITR